MQNRKLDTLTSLRFFAAAMIVIGHAHSLFGSAGIATTFSLAQGVSFFFVLSGFILAYNYPRLDSAAAVGKFWLARFARIWPAHIVLVLLLLLFADASHTEGLAPYQKILAFVANVFLLQSLVPFRDFFLSFNGVAWSISTELIFYLAFPLLLVKARKNWLLPGLVLAAMVAIYLVGAVLWSVPADESVRSLSLLGLLYVNPLVRLFEFFLGMLACRLFQFVRSGRQMTMLPATMLELAVLSIALCSLWLSPRILGYAGWQGPIANVLNFYLTKSGSALIFVFLIVVFALQRGWISWLLQRAVLVFLGEVSFALYLVHTIVLEWFTSHYELLFARFPLWQSYAAYWAASIFAAYLLYALIEQPCRKVILGMRTLSWRDKLSLVAGKKQLAPWAALFSIVIVAALWRTGQACSEQDCSLLQQRAAYHDVAAFQKIASLQAMSVDATPEGLTLSLLWSALKPDAEMKVALHVLDRRGEMIWHNDYGIVRADGLKSGERWIDIVKIPKAVITAEWAGLGIAMYKVPTDLVKVDAARTDWGQKRALLEIPEFRSALR